MRVPISKRSRWPSESLERMPSILGVSRASSGAPWPVARSSSSERPEVMWRSTNEPSAPAVTKLLSRVDGAMALTAADCGSSS